MQPDNVIHPDAFSAESLAWTGSVPAPPSAAPLPPQPVPGLPDMTGVANMVSAGANAVSRFWGAYGQTIITTAVVAGGTYALIKVPPLAAKSMADTAHYLREAWHGRGYDTK